jgi:flagellar hook assembly protein FlgD
VKLTAFGAKILKNIVPILLITTLVQSNFVQGEYTFQWNGTDRNGVIVSSGVYIMELNTSELRSVKKLTLLK